MKICRYIVLLMLTAMLAAACHRPEKAKDPGGDDPIEDPVPQDPEDPEDPDPHPGFVEEPDDNTGDHQLSFDYSVLARAGHPRLMMGEEDFAALQLRLGKQKASNVTLCKIHHVLAVKANSYASASAAISDPSAHENNVAELLTLAYAYRATGGSSYLAKIHKDLKNIIKWTSLGSSWLGIGEQSLALAVVYDWLYYDLSYDERVGLHKLLINKSVTPSLSGDFREDYGNWNQVGNGGAICAALALYEKDKSKCVAAIESGIANNKQILTKIMAGGGGYPEGASYWNYGMSYQVALLQSLFSIFGHTAGLQEVEGLMDSGAYALMVHSSTGSSFSYADGGSTGDPHMIPSWWYAAQKNDASLAYAENHLLDSEKYLSDYSRLMPLIPALLKDYNPDPVLEGAPDRYLWHCDGEMPLCIVRRGWTYGASDLYLGIKGGNCNTWKTMNTAHGHMDAGSFVFEAEGVRWSDDVMRPSYSAWFSALTNAGSRSGDTSQSGLRWSTFNVNALCHSTIVSYTNDGSVSGKLHASDQYVDGHAAITEVIDRDGVQGAVLDMSGPMKGQVKSATRSITLLADGSLEVKDVIQALDSKASVLEWRMLSKSTATLASDGILLKANSDASKQRKLSATSSDSSVTITYSTWQPVVPSDWTGFTYYQTITGRIIAGWKATVPAGKTVTFTSILRKI